MMTKAAQDLLHAADLLDRQGAPEQSEQIRQAVAKLQADEGNGSKEGNGTGINCWGNTLNCECIGSTCTENVDARRNGILKVET